MLTVQVLNKYWHCCGLKKNSLQVYNNSVDLDYIDKGSLFELEYVIRSMDLCKRENNPVIWTSSIVWHSGKS